MRNDAMNLSKNEMIMVMHDQEKEIAELRAQLAELREQLADYEIKVDESGTLAEAAAKISGLFETAQSTADSYISNIKLRTEKSEQVLAEVEQKAEQIISQAEGVAQKRLEDADAEIEKKKADAENEIDEKWAVIESRLLVLYESHKGLKELVESGIFSVPGAKQE